MNGVEKVGPYLPGEVCLGGWGEAHGDHLTRFWAIGGGGGAVFKAVSRAAHIGNGSRSISELAGEDPRRDLFLSNSNESGLRS